jgi:hypothetical protein
LVAVFASDFIDHGLIDPRPFIPAIKHPVSHAAHKQNADQERPEWFDHRSSPIPDNAVRASRSGRFLRRSDTMPAVMTPSTKPRGSWVGTNARAIFPARGQNGLAPLMPAESCDGYWFGKPGLELKLPEAA